MPVSTKTKNVIWGQFAGKCAICKENVIYENDDNDISLFGEVAHIIGENDGSARFNARISIEHRNSSENLILLCSNHHTIIDKKENLVEYSVEKLHQIKENYFFWIEAKLAKKIKWDIDLSHLLYLNIPRLSEVALKLGHKINLSEYNERQNLHSHGWDLNGIMTTFENVFSHLTMDAIKFSNINFIHEGYIGSLVYFDKLTFRTKNISFIERKIIDKIEYQFCGDLKLDPHIYNMHVNGWKLVLNINRNWITTDTAFSYFRPAGGRSTFGGFFRVTNIDYEENIMYGSPFAMGLPSSNLSRTLKNESRNEEINKGTKSFDDMINMKEALQRSEYYNYADLQCDFCSKKAISEEYLIDGKTTQGPWAWMCPKCFKTNGTQIKWGSGQLYQKIKNNKWLLVAGYDNSPEGDIFENMTQHELELLFKDLPI